METQELVPVGWLMRVIPSFPAEHQSKFVCERAKKKDAIGIPENGTRWTSSPV